jgi:hypothetical protein
MILSLPGCSLEVADLVRRTAKSGQSRINPSFRRQGLKGFISPVQPPGFYQYPVFFSIPPYATIPHHRAGAPSQRRNCRQQAAGSASLSDVLFILPKENTSSFTTSH